MENSPSAELSSLAQTDTTDKQRGKARSSFLAVIDDATVGSVMDSTVSRFESSCKLNEQGTAAAPSAARTALASVASAANTVRTPSWEKNASP